MVRGHGPADASQPGGDWHTRVSLRGCRQTGRAIEADTEVTVARQPSGKDAAPDDVKELAPDDPDSQQRSSQADAMWTDLRVQPVEIALPKGVGYTLRAYRLSTELTPTEVEEEEDDFAILNRPNLRAVEDENALDEDFFEDDEVDERPGVRETPRGRRGVDDDVDSDAVDDSDIDADAHEPETSDDVAESDEAHDAVESDDADKSDDSDEEDDDIEVEEVVGPEEVPAFLGHRGKVLLFRSVDELVTFVKSDAEHDLTQLDTWDDLKSQITVAAVVPSDEDRYELDLVVENLRGGRDAWDADLLIAAGEVARDLAFGLRLEAVRTALSPGSPLDDLDEALRAGASGGMSSFFARRRLKKIGAQQAALGWRTIIGKISAAVDWRD